MNSSDVPVIETSYSHITHTRPQQCELVRGPTINVSKTKISNDMGDTGTDRLYKAEITTCLAEH